MLLSLFLARAKLTDGQKPVGDSPDAETFFEAYLAAPIILALYGGWKIFSALSTNPRINYRGWKPYIRLHEIDVTTDMREHILVEDPEPERRGSVAKEALSYPKRVFNAFF